MKLKEFSKNDQRLQMNGKPVLHVSKSGVVRINAPAMRAIELSQGDKVLILQDEESPADWYLKKTTEEHGFSLRKNNAGLSFNSVLVAKTILNSLDLVGSASFQMAIKPVESDMYAILTHAAVRTNSDAISKL